MPAYDFITLLLGIVASIFSIASFQKKLPKQIFIMQIICGVFWSMHFIMLGAFSGALITFFTTLRVVAIIHLPQKFIKIFPFIYLSILYPIFFILIYDNAIDLFPLISGTIGAFLIYWRDSRYIVARASLLSSTLWLTYGYINGSVPIMFNDSFVILSILIGIIRYERPSMKSLKLSINKKPPILDERAV